MKRKTNEQFIEELSAKNPNVFTYDKYINATTKLKFYCKHNEKHTWMADPHHILNGRSCPYCQRKKAALTRRINNKINNRPTLLCNHNPELIQYLKNAEDANHYTYASHKKIMWKCIDCGFEFSHSISDFTRIGKHFTCPFCLNNDSYPNRFMFSMLKQLNIPFIKEHSPEWVKPKRYDFYFQINHKEYIVEMDGFFHSFEESKENDCYKDSLAVSHNIEVIRIDCIYHGVENRAKYIQEAIYASKLAHLLQLDAVDFAQCDKEAIEKTSVTVCKLWDSGFNITDICTHLRLSDTTVVKYLKHGEQHGYCTYNHKQQKEINTINHYKKVSITNGQAVMCNETKEVFPSMSAANKYYKCAVGEYFRYSRSYAGMLPDGTKLTWKKIPTTTYLKLNNQEALDARLLF